MKYYSIIKKKEYLPFAATWMDLDGVTLSEISQTKTNTVWYHLYVESNKYNKLMNITKENIENKLMVTNGEREGRRGSIGVEDQEVQTFMYKIRIYCTTRGI